MINCPGIVSSQKKISSLQGRQLSFRKRSALYLPFSTEFLSLSATLVMKGSSNTFVKDTTLFNPDKVSSQKKISSLQGRQLSFRKQAAFIDHVY